MYDDEHFGTSRAVVAQFKRVQEEQCTNLRQTWIKLTSSLVGARRFTARREPTIAWMSSR